jgi:hypothetical protein
MEAHAAARKLPEEAKHPTTAPVNSFGSRRAAGRQGVLFSVKLPKAQWNSVSPDLPEFHDYPEVAGCAFLQESAATKIFLFPLLCRFKFLL